MSLLNVSLEEFFATEWFRNSPPEMQAYVRAHPPNVMYRLPDQRGDLAVQIIAYTEQEPTCVVLVLGFFEETESLAALEPCKPFVIRYVPLTELKPIDEAMSSKLHTALSSSLVQSLMAGGIAHPRQNAQWN